MNVDDTYSISHPLTIVFFESIHQLTTKGSHILFIAANFSIIVRVGLFWGTNGIVMLLYFTLLMLCWVLT